VHPVGLVVLGRREATALLGEAVDQDRPVVAEGRVQRGLDGGDVVAVDRPDVAEPELLEDRLDPPGAGAALAEPASAPTVGW
jgi:hypothetical protein